MNTKTTLCIVGIVSLAACNLSGKIDAAIDKLDILCTPGEELACSCENGEDGSQTCSEAGTSFSDCLCGEGPQCNPGEIDTCVCDDNESIGIHECLGTSEGWDVCVCENESTSTGEESTSTSESIESTAAEPHFVLRDKNGEIVSTIFEPYCPIGTTLPCTYTQDILTYPCVHIKYYNDVFFNMAYDITTGDPRTCYPEFPDNKETWAMCAYSSNNCVGDSWCPQHVYFEQFPGTVIQINKEMYGLNTKNPGEKFEELFIYNDNDHACLPAENYWYTQPLWKLEKINETIAYGLMDRAPYTITLE